MKINKHEAIKIFGHIYAHGDSTVDNRSVWK